MVIGAVVSALIPPMILARIVDTLTAGKSVGFSVILFYFVMLALTGIMEAAELTGVKRVAETRPVISISHRTSAELGRIINLN